MTEKAPRLLIAYDLLDPNWSDASRNALYAALEKLGAKQIQETIWLVRSDEDPRAISLNLQKLLYPQDRLLVTHTTAFTSHNGMFDFRLL